MPFSLYDTGFGIEIECYLPEGGTMQAVATAVRARIDKPVHVTGYNHQTPPEGSWKITTDGSLGDYSRGMELVSCVLRGETGVTEAEKVIRALSDFGCTVNKKCGFHVHVGLADPQGRHSENAETRKTIQRLATMYATFEPVLDSLMPPSRRASNNSYCRSITHASPAAINAAASIGAVINLVNPGSSGGRYSKLNLHAFRKYGTAEFRQHSGTMEPNKVRNWILTCLRMVAAARNGAEVITAAPAPTQNNPVNRARHGSKSWQIGQMMLRPEGVTGPEACAAVGWPSVSMPQQAQICGLTYTTQRIGRSVRYFARAAQAEVQAQVAVTPTPITLLGFCELIGSDPNEREYLLQRQADLGGPISWAA